MVPISITKVYIEQNKGFFKEIDNPHIQSSLEIPARFEENDDIVLTINGMTIDGNITNSNERSARNLPLNGLGQLRDIEKKIIETKHVVMPLVINDETDQTQMQLIANYISTFRENTETNMEYPLEMSHEKVEDASAINNTQVTKREYKTTFRIEREPRNLYLLCGSYSIIEVRTPLGITLQKQYEKIFYIPIFERGELKTEADVYQLENGQIWYGAIRKTNQGLFFTTEENPRRLSAKKTLNTALIDLRILPKIERKKQNFRQLNESLLNSRIKQIQKTRNSFYFSDIFINQKNRIASCYFFFNDKKYILDNCLFSRIYETIPNDLANLVTLNSKITNFKIYRNRVQKSGKSKNKLSDTSESYELFQGNIEELVAESRQEGDNTQITARDNLQELYSLNFDLNQESRTFKLEDSFFIDKTEGMYQYRVEIEIDDFSIEIVKNDIKSLQSLIKRLSFYVETQNIEAKQSSADSSFSLQSATADSFLSAYFNTLNRYFINENLYNQNELFKIKQALKAQIVSSSKEPRGIFNFIKLINKLISDLTSFISLELGSFDDPHIDLELNQIQKNSKRIMTIQHRFSNNVVDASVAKIKNVNFFSSQQNRYDQFDFQQFSNFLIQMNNAGRIKQDRILPSSVSRGQFGSSLRGETREYIDEIQRSKNKRQNLLNNNLNVSVVQYKNNNNEEIENEENYLYRNDINYFYDYISTDLVKNKTIDETSLIFGDLNNPILLQFEGEIEFLTSTSQKSGSWTSLRNIGNLPSSYGNYLFCRIRPRRGDPNNKSWQSIEGITCTDPFFFVEIASREEAERLIQVVNSLMPNVNLSSNSTDINSQIQSEQAARDLSYRNVENLFFR